MHFCNTKAPDGRKDFALIGEVTHNESYQLWIQKINHSIMTA